MAREVKKKRWISIVAPLLFGNKKIGDVLVAEPDDALGRNVTVNMASLGSDSHRQTVNATFTIEKKDGDNLATVFKKYFIVPSALKKMVRRNRSKIGDSFIVRLKDGAVIKLKMLLVTRSRVRGSVSTSAFHIARAWCVRETSKLTFDQFAKEVVSKKFQRSLQQTMKKLCPLAICEVRYFEKLPEEKAARANVLTVAKEEAKA